MEMMKAILFDFGLTLVHSERWFDIEIETLIEDSLDIIEKSGIIKLSKEELVMARNFYLELREKARETGKEITAFNTVDSVLTNLGIKLKKEVINNAIEQLYRECLPTIRLGNGVKETLIKLVKDGYILGIISNARYSPFIFWVLDKFEIKKYFKDVIVSAAVGERKPFAEIFNIALNRLNIKPEEAFFVGDYYPYDIVGAKDVGMKTFWLNQEQKDEKREHADFVISEINEILNYLND